MLRLEGNTKDIIWVRDTVNSDKNRLVEIFAYEDSNGSQPASLSFWPRASKGTNPKQAAQETKAYIDRLTTGLDLKR